MPCPRGHGLAVPDMPDARRYAGQGAKDMPNARRRRGGGEPSADEDGDKGLQSKAL